MYRRLCLPRAYLSAAVPRSVKPSIASGYLFPTIFFNECKNFLISSSSSRTQCYTSILCRNLFRLSENRVISCPRVAASW